MQRIAQDARPPADWSTWPPPTILDVLYGNATLKRWATPTTIGLIHGRVRENYYTQLGSREQEAESIATLTAKKVEEHLKRPEE